MKITNIEADMMLQVLTKAIARKRQECKWFASKNEKPNHEKRLKLRVDTLNNWEHLKIYLVQRLMNEAD